MSDLSIAFAQSCFCRLIDQLLTDPTPLLHPWRSSEPEAEIAKFRQLAADLKLDYDALVRAGSVCQQNRLADIEAGRLVPVPRVQGGDW